jgi:integration host factor subunit alpha
MTMTKTELVDLINDELQYHKSEATRIVDSFFEIIKDDLAAGNNVLISSFGKWSVKEKNRRRGRNPQTGEELVIDARRVVVFKPSLKLNQEMQ